MKYADLAKKEMDTSIEHFMKELKNVRTGRAHPGILEDVKIEVYGTNMPIKSVANVTASEPRVLLISPFDPSTVETIANAIEKSDLNLMPQVDGPVIRIPVPALTEDSRKTIVKQTKGKLEDAKISIREARRKANALAKESEELTEDELRFTEKKVQEYTDQFCKKADELFAAKEKELMTV